MSRLKTIEWTDNSVRIVNQTKLPTELIYEQIDTVEQMYHAIKILKVREHLQLVLLLHLEFIWQSEIFLKADCN